ncbi:unnamed protein product [Tuber aestivum]|uniref:Uncharacterized protein n=1 Tax=Tuber aestivum TaxID=59557 RepID=A0A292PV42_9PEZI|nr:unnamed protein product [Tuber aestivum]
MQGAIPDRRAQLEIHGLEDSGVTSSTVAYEIRRILVRGVLTLIIGSLTDHGGDESKRSYEVRVRQRPHG